MLGLQAFADFDTSTKIYGYAEFGSSLCYYLDNDNNQAEVTSLPYGEYRGDIVIPSSIIAIPSNTDEEKTYSVTSIGRRAFSYCSGLTSITIPNSVTNIGGNAFTDCSRLTSISIPNSVTSIGGYAFSGCSGLTSVTIPNSVTSIGTNPFYGCTALTSVKVASGNTIYDSRNNCDAIIETASNTLIAGCKNTVIPNSVTSIGRRAFFGCSGLTSITIPNSVTSIGEQAFGSCSGLTSITIPNSVTSIGESAFSGTPWYDNQPNGVVYAGLNVYMYKGTMPDNTSITIQQGTLSISPAAFSGCSGLTSVTIPNSVTTIGEYNQEIKGETNVEIISVIA